jgi:hypothetical protein
MMCVLENHIEGRDKQQCDGCGKEQAKAKTIRSGFLGIEAHCLGHKYC